MENKDLIATALRMIGKNIILIADCINKEEEPSTVEEKPKRKTRKTAKAKTEEAADVHEAEPVPEEAEKPKVTFEQVRAALAKKSQMGYTSAVKNLVENYGVEKLSDIKPENYAEILEQAEMIGIDG
ncbi:MAG: hypothetical protein II931_06460 [Clostridia bacterium]|nr:hypothetical protein [Clostridia bacterium]